MARIRTIKPDAFTSDSLSSVSVLARWTFAGIWTYCDDEGRGRADARLIKAALYPIDDATTLKQVEKALDELEAISAICRYEVDGKPYLHCPGWGHQKINRPSESRLPECSRATHGGLSEESLRCVDGNREQGKEQGSEFAQERVSDSRFDEFWANYPRKTDKAKAKTAWAKATKTHDPARLIAAAATFAIAKRDTEQRFIPHPTTWLNGERWEDEVDNVRQLPQQEGGWFQPFRLPIAPAEIEDDAEAYEEWAEGRRQAWRNGERW